MSDFFKSKKSQGKNYENSDISPAEKICIRFFAYNESKHSTKLLNSTKIKPFFEKFNISRAKSNVIKKYVPSANNNMWDSINKLFNFDSIDPDPSYVNLIDYLRNSNYKHDEIQNFLIPLINDILPLYFRFFYVFTYKFKKQLEKYYSVANSNENERSILVQMIENVDKIFWIFFCQQHQYLNDAIDSFQVLMDLITNFIQPLLDPNQQQLLSPIALSLIKNLNKYLYSMISAKDDQKQSQPISSIDNSPIFSFLSILFLNLFDLQQSNIAFIIENVIAYLKLFTSDNSSKLIMSLNDDASFKNLDYFIFQIRKILSTDCNINDKNLKNSLLIQTFSSLLNFYLAGYSNQQNNSNKSQSKVSFEAISELIVQIYLWDINVSNPDINSIIDQNTISLQKDLISKDSFLNSQDNCIPQILTEVNEFEEKFFNTLDFDSTDLNSLYLTKPRQMKISDNYTMSNLLKEVSSILGQVFLKKSVLFDKFLTFLKFYMREKDNPILRMCLLKGLEESMTNASIMNTLLHTESIENFLSSDILYINYTIDDQKYWPSNDGFLTFFDLLTNYFANNSVFDNVKQYINDILSLKIQNATPMQMTSLLTVIYNLLFNQNSSESSNRLTFFYSPKSTLFDDILKVDSSYFIYLSTNYEKMKSLKDNKNDMFVIHYNQVLQAHLFILDFLKEFMCSNASVTYVFSQKSMSRIHHINLLFFDKRTQEMALQFYNKHILSGKPTYLLMISLKSLLKELANDIEQDDVISLFCKMVNLLVNVNDEHTTKDLVSNIILTNFFIHLVQIVSNIVQKFTETNDNLSSSQSKIIESLFHAILNFLSKLSCNSDSFSNHLTEKQQHYFDNLMKISKYVEIDDKIFNSLAVAIVGRNINDITDINEIDIVSQVAVRLIIELTYSNELYSKALTLIDRLTENSVNNQIICYKSDIFYFFIDHLFDKLPDLTHKIVVNISQSYFDKKALIKLVNKYEQEYQAENKQESQTENLNQQKQLKILKLFHKLLLEPPTIDRYSGSFFHINNTRNFNGFRTSEFPIEYPLEFSFHFKLYKYPNDTFLRINGAIHHKIEIKLFKEKIIVQFQSQSTLVSKEFVLPLSVDLFTWNTMDFVLNQKSFDLYINSKSNNFNIDNLNFAFNSSNVYYSIQNCIIDFEDILVIHSGHHIGKYTAKIVNKDLSFNISKGEFDAKFIGTSFKYSSTLESSIKFVGGIRIVVPLFNYIPNNQDNKISEEQFLLIFDLLEYSLRCYQDLCVDQHIFRILNSFFDKLNLDSFSQAPGERILQLFEIVKNPQLIKEMNAYLFSDFTLLNRFKGLLEQLFTKNKENALQLDLSFLQAFIRISFLNNDFNFQTANEYLIEVAMKDKNQSQCISYLLYFIITSYEVKDPKLIDLSFQILRKIMSTSQFLTNFPLLSFLDKKNEIFQYWTIEILVKSFSLFETDTLILFFRKNMQIINSIDIDNLFVNPQRIFNLVLYYLFNKYKEENQSEEQVLIDENIKLVLDNHVFDIIQVEFLPIISSMFHLFEKEMTKKISKTILGTLNNNTESNYYEFLSLLICYISAYGDESDQESLIELLAEIVFQNNEEKVFSEILLTLVIFSILFKWNYVSIICSLILSLLEKINNVDEKLLKSKQYSINNKLIMKILGSIISQPLLSAIKKSDYNSNNKYETSTDLIPFNKIIEIFLNDHQNWIFSVSSILPQVCTEEEKSIKISEIFNQLGKIIVKCPSLLLHKDPNFELSFSQIFIIFLPNLKKVDFIDQIADKISKIKENQSQYEPSILQMVGVFPNNSKLLTLLKSFSLNKGKTNDELLSSAKAVFNEMINKFDTSYMSKYKSSFESEIQLFSASLSRLTDKKAPSDNFQNSQFEYVNMQYEEQIERMKKHNSKVSEDLITSLQTNQNIGVFNDNKTDSNHYKIFSILDGIGRHSAMKRIKHFKDHRRASEKRDQIQRTQSLNLSMSIDNDEFNQTLLIAGFIDFKLDPYEVHKSSNQNLFEMSCQLVEIATVYTGKITITKASISFDSKEANRVLSSAKKNHKRFIEFNLSSLRFIFWRRFKHSLTGLEFFTRDGSSFLFQFKMQKDMRRCLKKLTDLLNSDKNYNFYVQSKPSKELGQSSFFQNNFTIPWQNGEMSNYEYLFWLNMISGRSFHDISQYPVFPWILKNYKDEFVDFTKIDTVFRDLSLPIGALNESRLEMLKEGMEALADDEKCLYNKHYMTAGFVTYYLMRCEPFTTMHIELQSGQFDNPNRLFASVQTMWDIVSGSSQNEFRELVPEFYSLPNFLENCEKYDLGITSENEIVNDVKLPKWASKPSTFIAINRLALESPYASSHINEWIDLIFGFKSRGKAAEEANNIFHPYTYPEIIENPEIVNDKCLLTAAQDWAVNYGTCAEQVFITPHPTKSSFFIPSSPFATSSFEFKMKELNKSTVLKNPYAVSFVISKMHKKNAGRLIKIKMVSLQHPDTIGIIKVTQANQEKENLTLSENLTSNDLLDINLENSIFNNNSSQSNISIISKELCKFKTTAGTAKFLKASEMLGSLTVFNPENCFFISSAPWIDYFEVVFYKPSLKQKKKTTTFKSIIGGTTNIDSLSHDFSNPSFQSQPQSSCIKVLACDQWAVVTGFENSSIAVWDLRHNINNFNCNSVINSSIIKNVPLNSNINASTTNKSDRLEPLFYIFGHSGSILSVDVSVDLNMIVSVDSNNLVLMSFLSNGERIRSFYVSSRPKKVFIFSLGFIIFIYEQQIILSNENNDSELSTRKSIKHNRMSDINERPVISSLPKHFSLNARSDSFSGTTNSHSDSNSDSANISSNFQIHTTIELRDLSGKVISVTQKHHRADVFCKCTTSDYSQFLMISFSMKLNSNNSCVFLYRIYDLLIVALKPINGKVLSAAFDKKSNMFSLCIEEMPCVLLKIVPNDPV